MIRAIKESWLEFISQLPALVIATGPWILSLVILDLAFYHYIDEANASVNLIIILAEQLLKMLLVFSGMKLLYKKRGLELNVTFGKLINYAIALAFTGVAVLLAMMLFVIPGLIIMAASFFVPIFILKDGKGPIEAVASSASLLRGNIFKVTLCLCIMWLGIIAVEYVSNFLFGFLSAPEVLLTAFTSGLLLVVGLVTFPVMVNVHQYLMVDHNKRIQPTPEGAA